MLREIENEARDMEVIPAREFNGLYICLDIVFRAMLGALLLRKRRMPFLFGLFGGALYFAVDYGAYATWPWAPGRRSGQTRRY